MCGKVLFSLFHHRADKGVFIRESFPSTFFQALYHQVSRCSGIRFLSHCFVNYFSFCFIKPDVDVACKAYDKLLSFFRWGWIYGEKGCYACRFTFMRVLIFCRHLLPTLRIYNRKLTNFSLASAEYYFLFLTAFKQLCGQNFASDKSFSNHEYNDVEKVKRENSLVPFFSFPVLWTHSMWIYTLFSLFCKSFLSDVFALGKCLERVNVVTLEFESKTEFFSRLVKVFVVLFLANVFRTQTEAIINLFKFVTRNGENHRILHGILNLLKRLWKTSYTWMCAHDAVLIAFEWD